MIKSSSTTLFSEKNIYITIVFLFLSAVPQLRMKCWQLTQLQFLNCYLRKTTYPIVRTPGSWAWRFVLLAALHTKEVSLYCGIHQSLPNMLAVADDVWFICGERNSVHIKQKVPREHAHHDTTRCRIILVPVLHSLRFGVLSQSQRIGKDPEKSCFPKRSVHFSMRSTCTSWYKL